MDDWWLVMRWRTEGTCRGQRALASFVRAAGLPQARSRRPHF